MKHILLVLLAALTVGASAQDDMPLAFTPLSEDPVVAHSTDRQAFDGTFTDPGAVIYHDGLFHLFRNGFRSWPGVVAIEHLTSDDAVTWTPAPAGPSIESTDVPYSGVAALASAVLVEDDGTWVLYFYTHEAFSSAATGRIGRATAPSPEGPWTIDAEPVLEPGPEGAWDELRVNAPRVFATDDGFVMYYTGIGNQATGWMSIGRATSPDGIVWTKYDDPETGDALYAESDPVLASQEDAGWMIQQSSVFPTVDGFLMFYRTFPPGGGDSQMAVHAATSADGIVWTPLQEEPVWDRNTIRGRTSGFWFTAAARTDDAYYLFVEEGSMAGTDIYAGRLSLE